MIVYIYLYFLFFIHSQNTSSLEAGNYQNMVVSAVASSSSSARFPRPTLLPTPMLMLLPILKREEGGRREREEVGLAGVIGENSCIEDCDDLLECNVKSLSSPL